MEVNKLKFRNASLEDISSIIEIEHAAFAEVICESEEVFIERVKVFPEGFRLMEYEGKVIGYISSELWNANHLLSDDWFKLGHSIADQHQPEGSEIYVSSMGILPQYRSQGLGKLMFYKFVRYAAANFHNVDSIILIVSEKWIQARKIYKSGGFKEIQKIKSFFQYQYKEPIYEDGIVMRKQILKD